MRIGIVYLGEFPPKIGGGGADRRVRDIARGLAGNEDATVTMLVPRRSAEQTQVDIDGIQVLYLGSTHRSYLQKCLSRLAFWRKVVELSRKLQFDWVLLYSTTIDSFLPAWRLRSIGTKIAVEMCDLRSVGFSKKSIRNLLRSKFHTLDENWIPWTADLNIVISRFLEDHVRKIAPNTPVLRIPVLVDRSLFAPVPNATENAKHRFGIHEDDFVVAYVGGLWKQEGVQYLVRAFRAVVNNFPNAKLVIAGRLVPGSDDHDDIEAITNQLNLRDRVVLTGWVSTDDVKLIYTRADTLVLPQINDKFARAALPTKLAEYSAMETPIVATRVGDVTDYFTDGENALLIDSENEEQLTLAISSVISQPELRRKLALGAKAVSENCFDYRISGKRIIDCFRYENEVLSGSTTQAKI